jgi:hypothetical protein
MTFRRILLTYGILAVIAGLFLAVRTTYLNLLLKPVPATVTEVTQEPVTIKHSDSTFEERMMDVVNAEYECYGVKDTIPLVPGWTKGLTSKQIDKLKVGDKVEVLVDPMTGDAKTRESYTLAIMQCAIAAVMIYLGRNGRKGYKAEFFDRYKLPFIVTMVLSGVVLGYSIYEEFFYAPGGFMPGMAALGAFLWVFGIMMIALIIEIVMWTVAIVRYRKREKQLNDKQ